MDQTASTPSGYEHTPDPEACAAIVVGSGPAAELADRAAARRLCALMREQLPAAGLSPIILTDVWYLNNPAWAARPAVSIGPPEINALTAQLAARLPSAYVRDGEMMVQFDMDIAGGSAACWGVTPEATGRAVDVFVERYLAIFVGGLSAPARR